MACQNNDPTQVENLSTEGKPSVGGLLSRSFSVFDSGVVPCVTLALIFHFPLLLQVFSPFAAPSEEKAAQDLSSLIPFLSVLLLTMPLAVLANAGMVYGVCQLLRGRTMSVGHCIQVAASRAPSVIGLAILSTLVIAVSTLFFVIPGVVVLCGLFAAVPVLMAEKVSAFDAMSRSWSLTRGFKGTIFLFLLVLGLIQSLPPIALAALSEGLGLASSAAWLKFVVVVDYGINSIFAALDAVAAVVLYHALRRFRQGGRGRARGGLWRRSARLGARGHGRVCLSCQEYGADAHKPWERSSTAGPERFSAAAARNRILAR